MIKYYFYLGIIAIAIGCQSGTSGKNVADAASVKAEVNYPAPLLKVFDAHGGLDQWQKMLAMSYEIVKTGGNEKQFIDLMDRREKIEAPDFTMGFDGSKNWIEADTSYKGNPVFYKNLMFYFYAMPFVLADDGITYTKADDLVFDGASYPGYRISYGDGVGVSPEDEYFIHYDDQDQMAWLGYTVTYFSKEKSKKISWIRYDDWTTYNGLVLPKTLSWYEVENNLPISMKNKREFAKVNVSEQAFEDAMFAKTAGADYVE